MSELVEAVEVGPVRTWLFENEAAFQDWIDEEVGRVGMVRTDREYLTLDCYRVDSGTHIAGLVRVRVNATRDHRPPSMKRRIRPRTLVKAGRKRT